MPPSEKYAVPAHFALLYDFVNSLDLRSYVYHGVPHANADELTTAAQLTRWMSARNLVKPHSRIGAKEHRQALQLREALRSFLHVAPGDRLSDAVATTHLNEASLGFPLVVNVTRAGDCTLRAAPGSGVLSAILAEFYRLAASDSLHRLKMCASDECHWIFYDLSKPSNRRWCSSDRCGNREKTRTYRRRRREMELRP